MKHLYRNNAENINSFLCEDGCPRRVVSIDSAVFLCSLIKSDRAKGLHDLLWRESVRLEIKASEALASELSSKISEAIRKDVQSTESGIFQQRYTVTVNNSEIYDISRVSIRKLTDGQHTVTASKLHYFINDYTYFTDDDLMNIVTAASDRLKGRLRTRQAQG